VIYSMTGFGRASAEFNGLDLAVEAASVNRRNLELAVTLPREWQSLERDVQARIRSRVNRGKVNLAVQVAPAADAGGFHWDADGLESTLVRMEKVAQRHGVAWPPDAEALVRLAALNKVEARLPEAGMVATVLAGLVETALDELLQMRRTEGQALSADLTERRDVLKDLLKQIRSASSGTVPHFREQLLGRLRQLGLEIDLSDERVLKELSLFADKCDISEERTRLESHLEQFSDCLETGSPVGRKLEFIVQEMHREFNTIGSKAGNVEVNRLVIDAKNEMERVREQIQNIE